MGDLNGGTEDTDISKLVVTNKLYDAMASHHCINSSKTFINGSKTIEMFLTDEITSEIVTKVGMLKFNVDIDSDHRGMFCDLNKMHFIQGEIHCIEQRTTIKP
eukprot:8741979-Ditylum_brightwellii.AAC.1